MQTENMKAAARLLQAGRDASYDALFAENDIKHVPGTHADFVVLLAAIAQRMSEIRGVDFSAVLDALDEADAALDKVYAISPEERSEAVGNEMKESRDE